MRILIAAIGKQKAGAELDLTSSFIARTPWKIELLEIKPSVAKSREENISADSEMLMVATEKSEYRIALDSSGENLSSHEIASLIDNLGVKGTSSIGFMIGGSDGLSAKALNTVDKKISFGRQTWPHMMVRAMLSEQIYRAYCILNNHPYSK